MTLALIVLLPIAIVLATLMLLAWGWGIYPDHPLVAILMVPALLAVGVVFLPDAWPFVVLVDTLIVVLAATDLSTLRRSDRFEVERQVGRIASLRKPHTVQLVVTNRTGRDLPVEIRDGVPAGFAAEPDQFSVRLPTASRAALEYTLRPERRGAFTIEAVYLRLQSRLNLWLRQVRRPCESRLDVYPDMQQLGEYALLARTNRLSMMGLRRTRRLGQDNEFERLRDYTLDDNYRHIDWRSTARRNKLTVRDFQANQSQRVIFVVDCGRMMTGEAAGISLLDHALNAMLMLSYVALRRNDQVGLLCFSDTIHTFVPPRGGSGQMNRLLHAAYDRFPQMVESRYADAFLHLATHVRKRALVVLITNVIDEVNAKTIERHLTALGGRHLPLAVLLRDHALFNAVEEAEALVASTPAIALSKTTGDTRLADFQDLPTTALFEAAAAADILHWRRQVLADLARQGVLLVDAFAEQLTGPLVNKYLEVKARHLL